MSITNLLQDWDRYRRGTEDGGFHRYEHMWAMAIDLDTCIGCNACSTACYAENNLAVVGKETFSKGQAMHWMRIERYWDATTNGEVHAEFHEQGAGFVPMMCQQCHSAPCEPV